MTLRDIWLALSRIDIRRHNNYALQASLHGHKIKLRSVQGIKAPDEQTFTNEDNLKAEMALKRAMERMRKKA